MYYKTTSGFSGMIGAFMLSLAAAPANAEVACTVQTAKNVSEVTELCECQTVTKGLLRYLQRSRNFGDVASALYAECPALATVLADFAPAATSGGPGDPGGSDGGNDGNGGPSGGGPSGDGPSGDGPSGDGPTGGGDPNDGGGDPNDGGGDPNEGGGDPNEGGGDPNEGGSTGGSDGSGTAK
ncbi:hypothetical protein [Roseovarius sp. EL26]|uniref:hypothetical protein n=1 Tax=Roseovarius sp. EL26 TaxID=2126672 RepID=UPI000EA02F47|nr:hypothetical protein [Roseovarius sp. EL26]